MTDEIFEESRPDQESAAQYRPLRDDPYITTTLVLLNWAIYLISSFYEPYNLVSRNAWGSMSAYKFCSGQWWLPLSSLFLHYSIAYVAFNTLFIFVFGRKVERVLGHAAFLFLYLTSGLIATLGVYRNTMGVNYGAAGALYGVFGAYFFYYQQILHRTSRLARPLAWLGLSLALGSLWIERRLDMTVAMHGLGLVTGFACMAIACRRHFHYPKQKRWKIQLVLTGIALLFIFSPLIFFPNPVKAKKQAHAMVDRGNYQQAMADLTRPIFFFPHDGWLYEERGYCHTRLDQDFLADADYDLAIKMDPYSPTPLVNRGLRSLAKNQLEVAAIDFRRAFAMSNIKPGLKSYCDGCYYLHTGKYQDAIDCFTKALNLNWSPVRVLGSRGEAYCASGQLDKAEADWMLAIQDNQSLGNKAGYLNCLGLIALRRGKWAEAFQLAEEAETTSKGMRWNPLIRLIAADKLGKKDLQPDPVQVRSRLKDEDLRELKRLLPVEFWHYMDDRYR